MTITLGVSLSLRETRIDTESGDSRNRRRTCTTCSARTNKTEEVVEKFEEIDPNDLMGLLRDEYSNGNNASESLAFSPIREKNNNVQSTDIWKELDKANHKRHLKNLKRFLTNREIVTAETIISELGDESLFEDDDFNNDSFSPNK